MKEIISNPPSPSSICLRWERLSKDDKSDRSLVTRVKGAMAGACPHNDGGWLPFVVCWGPSEGFATGPMLARRRDAVRWCELVLAHSGLPLAAMVLLGAPEVAGLPTPLERLLAAAAVIHVTVEDEPVDLGEVAEEGYPQAHAAIRGGRTRTDVVLAECLSPAELGPVLAMVLAVSALMRRPGDKPCRDVIRADAVDILPETDPEPGRAGRDATAIARAAGLEIASAARKLFVYESASAVTR